jgi:hypothetical protein
VTPRGVAKLRLVLLQNSESCGKILNMNNANASRLDYDAAVRGCDCCNASIEPGQQVNPTTDAEAFCSRECWSDAEDAAAPEPADVGRTVRIRNVPMVEMVYGGAQ